jgi:hypothetical protein
MARSSTRNQRPNPAPTLAVEYADEIDQYCAQVVAIAGLIMDADVDRSVQDAAWAIRCLVERARQHSDALFHLTSKRA